MDDSQETIDETTIPNEEASQQAVVPFMGDELAAAMTTTGDIYITLNGICEALGLSPRPQLRRILRTKTLTKGLRRISIKTPGGAQRINCLRIDKVALWIAGMEPSRIKPVFQEKIEAFQEELAPIATRVFMRVMGIPTPPVPSTTDSRLTAILEQYDTLMDAASLLREHAAMIAHMPGQLDTMSMQMGQAVTLLESLTQRQDATEHAIGKIEAKTQGLTPDQQENVRRTVESIAHDSAGGTTPLDFSQVYAALKRKFKVGSYKQIPDSRYEEVMIYLRDLWRRTSGGNIPEQSSLF